MGISNGRFNPVEPKINSNQVALDYNSIICTKFTPKSTDDEDNQLSNDSAPVKQENCLTSETESVQEIRSLRQTDSNPNTANPRDTNRPATLLEQFSEIYDNEWSRAFEYLIKDDSNREEIIRRLLNILQEIYAKCQEYTKKQIEDLTDNISAYLRLYQEAKDQVVLKETEKGLLEHRSRNYDINLDHVTKDVRRHLQVQPDGRGHDSLENYIQKCIRICWLMCIKCPQIHLDFGVTPADEGQLDDVNDFPLYFNTTKFVSYMRAGMYVEYIVWPAVYLHKDGPILKKGVAQGVNIKPELMV
ncbi:hypothetical protein CHS0354_035512 [Potamilus streckersoni]|uniref:Mitochondria-eating protein C-terminal domain-containing protein n=1 Tax=Potamilus streckersoni TaxID=2493646 RepID=A0AAE0VJC6_9BIVA|nr:hypothetical protein CHS0354_035512 [Potamilus streckersoni]